MAKQLPEIDSELAAWISMQKMFFVGSAPLSEDGHVNVSPKGGDSFRVLGPMEVAYLDYTGSGAETVAHIRENRRLVIMFCAFDGGPKIVRLHGKASVLLPGEKRFEEIYELFPHNSGTRSIVCLEVERVSSACGFSVPYYDYRDKRDTLDRWSEAQGPEKLEEYRAAKNVKSIDGLAAFD